jgi:hypothetical protein
MLFENIQFSSYSFVTNINQLLYYIHLISNMLNSCGVNLQNGATCKFTVDKAT